MFCVLCAKIIKRAISRLDGVTNVNIEFALASGTVEYYPSLVTVDEMIQRVRQLGYKARIKEESQNKKIDHLIKNTNQEQGTLPKLLIKVAEMAKLR
ncbi:hypothetical protein CVD19_05025 [Bacillus sp. T33-2]|nr:hypothetical protein CVD19_05025 [Bacillus sp. T33-2]